MPSAHSVPEFQWWPSESKRRVIRISVFLSGCGLLPIPPNYLDHRPLFCRFVTIPFPRRRRASWPIISLINSHTELTHESRPLMPSYLGIVTLDILVTWFKLERSHTYRVIKSRFTVVSMQNTESIRVLLFINHCIIFHTNRRVPTFAPPCTTLEC